MMGQSICVPKHPQRCTCSSPHVSSGPTPPAPQVEEVPLLESLAQPVVFDGSMYQAPTLHEAGVMGWLPDEASTVRRMILGHSHRPSGPWHASFAACSGVRVSIFFAADVGIARRGGPVKDRDGTGTGGGVEPEGAGVGEGCEHARSTHAIARMMVRIRGALVEVVAVAEHRPAANKAAVRSAEARVELRGRQRQVA